MNIYPQDLGPNQELVILQSRLEILLTRQGMARTANIARRESDGEAKSVTPKKIIRKYARRCLRFPLFCGAVMTLGFGNGMGLSGLDLLGLAVCGTAAAGEAGFIYARWKGYRACQDPIQPYEINYLTGHLHNPLAREYGQAILMLLAVPPPKDAQVERNIRQSVLLLGQAVDNLPIHLSNERVDNPQHLQSEMKIFAERAQTEPDPVIAASYERRARTLAQCVEVINQTMVVTRRNQVLREEIEGQIKALRTSIVSSQLSGKAGMLDLSALAANIAQVAEETAAVAKAHAELETAAPRSEDLPEMRKVSIVSKES